MGVRVVAAGELGKRSTAAPEAHALASAAEEMAPPHPPTGAGAGAGPLEGNETKQFMLARRHEWIAYLQDEILILRVRPLWPSGPRNPSHVSRKQKHGMKGIREAARDEHVFTLPTWRGARSGSPVPLHICWACVLSVGPFR